MTLDRIFRPNDFLPNRCPINRIFISPRRFYLHRNSAAAHCLPRTATIFPRGGKGRGNFEKPSSSRHNISSNFRIKRKKKISIGNPISPPLPPSLSKRFDLPRRADDTRGIKKRRDYPRAGTRRLIRARACVGEEPWGCTAVEINRGWPELSSNLISARHRWPTTESRAASVRWREG